MDILTVNGVLGDENIDSSSPMHPPGLAEAHGELGEPVADAIKEEEAEQANATNLQETQEWLQWQEWQQYKEETEQDGLSWDQQGLHMANDQVWSVWSGVGSASADPVPDTVWSSTPSSRRLDAQGDPPDCLHQDDGTPAHLEHSSKAWGPCGHQGACDRPSFADAPPWL